MWRILLILVTAGVALAQPPLIYNRKILNVASYLPPNLPGGAIALGSVFSIFGERLGPAQPVQATAFPLGTTLGNVSITVTQGTTTMNVIPIYVRDTQINAIMPSTAPLGAVSVRVTYNNFRSNSMRANVAQTAPGIFTALGLGLGPGSLINFVSQDNQPINSPYITAKRGQFITLWATGLGPVASDVVLPTPGLPTTRVEVFVGGVAATVAYSGRSGCCSGFDQIVFTVPPTAPYGCWVPVAVRTAGTVVSNFVSMGITADGSSCFDSSPAIPFIRGGKYGAVAILRATTREDIGVAAPIDVTGDFQASIAYEVQDSPFPFQAILSLPPAGTCTSYSVKGDLLRGNTLPGFVPAGSPSTFSMAMSLTGPRGTKTLSGLLAASILTTGPFNFLGGSLSGNQIPNTSYLEPGSYQLSGIGTTSIGAFSATFSTAGGPTWSNRDQISVVDRTQPLTINWTGGATDQDVGVIGFGVDLPGNSTTVFGCFAPDGAKTLTVPPLVMANVPATRANPLTSKSVIYLVSYPESAITKLNATGVASAYSAVAYLNGKTVVFK